MRISRFQIRNYKSFLVSEEVSLTSGFNVIIGQNNAGKSALLEALSTSFENMPHRSRKTLSNRGDIILNSMSEAEICFELKPDELSSILRNRASFFVPIEPRSERENREREVRFLSLFEMPAIALRCTFQGGNAVTSAFFEGDGNIISASKMEFRINPATNLPERTSGDIISSSPNTTIAFDVAQTLRTRVYFFKAERLKIGEAGSVQPTSILTPDASNLPQVLHVLLTKNRPRFERFERLVKVVFPQITQITIPPVGPNTLRIMVWDDEPDLWREDLAIALAESGTGISQVLAILYVVVTADFPQTIIIDEPQSFLHPGAVRKLIRILKANYPQHQYIVATHSPIAMTEMDPQTILLVRKEQGESAIRIVNVTEAEELRGLLSEIGTSLADVFGAD